MLVDITFKRPLADAEIAHIVTYLALVLKPSIHEVPNLSTVGEPVTAITSVYVVHDREDRYTIGAGNDYFYHPTPDKAGARISSRYSNVIDHVPALLKYHFGHLFEY